MQTISLPVLEAGELTVPIVTALPLLNALMSVCFVLLLRL